MEFTINKINDNGSVDVTFSDKSKQNITGLPVHNSEALVEALVDYTKAYFQGIELEKSAKKEVAVEVKELAGEKISVEKFLADKEALEAARLKAEQDALAAEQAAIIAEEATVPQEVPQEEVVVETPVVVEERPLGASVEVSETPEVLPVEELPVETTPAVEPEVFEPVVEETPAVVETPAPVEATASVEVVETTSVEETTVETENNA